MKIWPRLLLFQTADRRGDRGTIGRRSDVASVRANQVAQQMPVQGEHELRALPGRSAKAATAELQNVLPALQFYR